MDENEMRRVLAERDKSRSKQAILIVIGLAILAVGMLIFAQSIQ